MAARAINLYQAIVAWYEDKLRGRSSVAASLPELCLSLDLDLDLDLDQGLDLRQMPANSIRQVLPADLSVRPLSSGWLAPSRFVALREAREPSAFIGASTCSAGRMPRCCSQPCGQTPGRPYRGAQRTGDPASQPGRDRTQRRQRRAAGR